MVTSFCFCCSELAKIACDALVMAGIFYKVSRWVIRWVVLNFKDGTLNLEPAVELVIVFYFVWYWSIEVMLLC